MALLNVTGYTKHSISRMVNDYTSVNTAIIAFIRAYILMSEKQRNLLPEMTLPSDDEESS